MNLVTYNILAIVAAIPCGDILMMSVPNVALMMCGMLIQVNTRTHVTHVVTIGATKPKKTKKMIAQHQQRLLVQSRRPQRQIQHLPHQMIPMTSGVL